MLTKFKDKMFNHIITLIDMTNKNTSNMTTLVLEPILAPSSKEVEDEINHIQGYSNKKSLTIKAEKLPTITSNKYDAI